LKLIQVGFTLSDAEGNFPEDISTWQFNLAFDKQYFLFYCRNDLNSIDSICLLENAGIDFDRLSSYGAPHSLFAESLFPSGLILNDNLNWITFHGVYDFAYLLRLVSNLPLPNEEITFYNDLETFFPNFYDTRYLLNNFSWLKGSLTKIASDLDIQHFGAIHQAGSDSLVTSKLFYRIEENFPELDLNAEKNKLYGLGNLLNEK
jgi:CCR4-NOT transcription complex subunit 7/8